MTDQNWIVTDCSTDTPQPWIYKGAAPGRSYEGLLLDVMKLGHENDELRQRIAELERFAKAVCAEYEEYPDDPTQPFAGYESVLEWVQDSRRDERDYAELQTCPTCEEGYPPHTCASYLDLVKTVRADKARIAELERELAIARHPSNQQPKERK